MLLLSLIVLFYNHVFMLNVNFNTIILRFWFFLIYLLFFFFNTIIQL
jgi:hypothetical protein